MNRIQLFTLRQKIEQYAQQKLERDIAAMHQSIQREEQSLGQLEQYLRDYEKTLDTKMQGGIHLYTLDTYRHFIRYLESVTLKQKDTLQQLYVKENALKQAWRQQFLKNQSIQGSLSEKKGVMLMLDEKKATKLQEDILSSRFKPPST